MLQRFSDVLISVSVNSCVSLSLLPTCSSVELVRRSPVSVSSFFAVRSSCRPLNLSHHGVFFSYLVCKGPARDIVKAAGAKVCSGTVDRDSNGDADVSLGAYSFVPLRFSSVRFLSSTR